MLISLISMLRVPSKRMELARGVYICETTTIDPISPSYLVMFSMTLATIAFIVSNAFCFLFLGVMALSISLPFLMAFEDETALIRLWISMSA